MIINSDDSVRITTARGEQPSLRQTIAIAFVLLMFWLTSIAYLDNLPERYQVVVVPCWIIAFVLIHLLPSHGSQKLQTAGSIFRGLGHGIPRRALPWLVLLVATVAVFEPWWHGLFTIGCRDAALARVVWPKYELTNGHALAVPLSLTLFVLRTATYPLVEESAFRGWLMIPLRSRFGSGRAILTTSLLFSLLHLRFSWGSLTSYFLFGLILGYLVLATGSIWAAIAVHYTWNLTGFVMSSTARPYLLDAFATPLFRCAPSVLLVGTSLAIMGTLIRILARTVSPSELGVSLRVVSE